MQKLHLVGFTTDHEGLILSARRGARSGSYLLTIDDAVEEAVDERRARREEEIDDEEVSAAARRTRVESALPVREIQARLRQGRSIAEVARAAGVDAEWVDRFAPPVLAERAQVIRKVRSVPLRRARLGPSVMPIEDAVRHHLADRGVSQTPDEFAAAWTARQVAEGRWAVRFTFHHRGHDQVLRFDLDESTGEVSTPDRVSSLMGYVAPRASTPTASSAERSRRPSKPADEPRPIAKRAVVSTGFRPEPTGKAVSRSAKEREKAAVAMRKAAAKRAVEGERAAARLLRERRAAAGAPRARGAGGRGARAARESLAAQRAAEAAALAKKAAAKGAAAKKAAAAKKVAAEGARATKKVAAKASSASARATAKKTAKKTAKRGALKRGVERKTVAKSSPAKRKATKRASKKAPAKRARATSSPASAAVKQTTAKPPAPRPSTAKAATAVSARSVAASPTPTPATVLATRVTVSEPAVRSAPVLPQAALAVPSSPDGARLTGAAENVYGMESARAMFRRGLVEQASGDVAVTAEPLPSTEPPPNGAALVTRGPGPDRPRRTRPLRAT